jgi:hypothetical protein
MYYINGRQLTENPHIFIQRTPTTVDIDAATCQLGMYIDFIVVAPTMSLN